MIFLFCDPPPPPQPMKKEYSNQGWAGANTLAGHADIIRKARGNLMTQLLTSAVWLDCGLRNELPEDFPADVEVGFLPNPNDQSDWLVEILNPHGYTNYVGQEGTGAHSAVANFEKHLHKFGVVTHNTTTWFGENNNIKVNAMMLDPTSKLVLAYPVPLKDSRMEMATTWLDSLPTWCLSNS